MLKDTRVSTFVMTSDGIHHCRLILMDFRRDEALIVGKSVTRIGRKRKILVEVGPGTSCTELTMP
jgi:hypothetical protein